MKKSMMFLLALTLFTSSTCEKEPSFIECPYTELEAELFCTEGVGQFQAVDGTIRRHYTLQDILRNGKINDFSSLPSHIKKDIEELKSYANYPKRNPPICPVGLWIMQDYLLYVYNLQNKFNIINASLSNSDGVKYPADITNPSKIRFNLNNLPTINGAYQYNIDIVPVGGGQVITCILEFELKMRPTF